MNMTMDAEMSTVAKPETHTDSLLTVHSLDVAYSGANIIHNLSLTVRRGSVSALMGRNGVGKTTLVKALMGLQRPGRGEIRYKGETITGLPAYARSRRGMGYVPQGRGIFPRLTVEENLKTGLRKARQSIPAAVYEYFPVLGDMQHRLGGDLSGGQQQQLAIGRALVTEPDLLILDEPTEGIQPSIIRRIGETLELLSETAGVTIIIVEQYLDFIREYADDFTILNRGTVAAAGETAELSSELIAEYLHL